MHIEAYPLINQGLDLTALCIQHWISYEGYSAG